MALYTLTVTVDLGDNDEAEMVLHELVTRSEPFAAVEAFGWTVDEKRLAGIEWGGR